MVVVVLDASVCVGKAPTWLFSLLCIGTNCVVLAASNAAVRTSNLKSKVEDVMYGT